MKQTDLLSNFELPAALIGLNPSVEKDIKLIEQATSAFFVTYSVFNLKTLESLEHIDYNIMNLLEKRNAIVSYLYFLYESSRHFLKKNIVLIRPVSLKMDDVERVKKVCNDFSLISLLQYLRFKEQKYFENSSLMANQIVENILTQNKNLRNAILDMILKFESYSLESVLSMFEVPEKIQNYMIQFLLKHPKELLDYLISYKELDNDTKKYLSNRNESILFELNTDFHILYPDKKFLIQLYNNEYKMMVSEPESLLNVAKTILLKLLSYIEAKEEKEIENQNFEQIYQVLSQHPSLQSQETWPGLSRFLESTNLLIQLCNQLNLHRKEELINYFSYQILEKINLEFQENYNLYYLNLLQVELPEIFFILFSENSKLEITSKILEIIKKNQNFIVYKSTTDNGYYIIDKINVPLAFIHNKNLRNFIHVMVKQSGYPGGIYDFVIDPQKLRNLQNIEIISKIQEQLHKAIKEWEKEKEKKKKKTLFQRFWEWILAIFGISLPEESISQNPLKMENQKQTEEHKNTAQQLKKIRKKTRSPLPKEKLKMIPDKIEKSISFVERNFDGFIWLDELAKVLNFNINEIEKLSSILYYDKFERFEEIKPLRTIKPLFINRENLYNYDWVKEKIESLEKSSKLPHQMALLEYLKSQLSLFE